MGQIFRKNRKNMKNDKYARDIFDFIMDNNDGFNNPYHSTYHLTRVYNLCMKLYDEYQEEYKLNEVDKVDLSIAALFHDYNHSGGKLDDKENIKNAISGFLNYEKLYEIEANYDKGRIIELISCTEYPHKEMELGILHKIIRDADTLDGITENWFIVISTLSDEYNIPIENMIEKQLEFIDNVKYNLPYCNNLLKEKKEDIKNKLKDVYSRVKMND